MSVGPSQPSSANAGKPRTGPEGEIAVMTKGADKGKKGKSNKPKLTIKEKKEREKRKKEEKQKR